jgi:hypothetical protein
MLLTLPQLKTLVAKLEASRVASGTSGAGDYCDAPNADADGNAERWEPKPRARQQVGFEYPDGTTLEDRDGVKGIRVPLGMHGRAHLAIDPETGEVACAKCAEARR